MAMIKCKECGNQISNKAKSCPQCGNPVKKSSKIVNLFIIIVLSTFIFNLLPMISPDSDSSDLGSTAKDRSTTNNRNTKTTLPPKSEFLYVCRTYPIGSNIQNQFIRTAPNMTASMDKTGDISPSEKIYVLEEKGEWIRFRVTPKDEGWSAWTPKKYTISIEKLNAEREAKFGKCPSQIGSNGSVRIVKNYLRTIAKDPSSLEYDKCSDVYYNENDGWVVLCVYRGKNSFGGYDKAANWFVIQHGQVVDIKEADAYSFN